MWVVTRFVPGDSSFRLLFVSFHAIFVAGLYSLR
jgi:hypothetical protein